MSSEIQSYDPCGRAHAGEVSRRNDRQENALPPPEWQGPTREGRPYHGNWRRRMAPGGGHNSDSDSDNDDRRGTFGGADDTLLDGPRRDRFPLSPETWDESVPGPNARARMEQAMQTYYMHQLLEFLRGQVELVFAESDRALQEKHLLQSVPAEVRPSAVDSETRLIMGQYVDSFMEAMVRVPPVMLQSNRQLAFDPITPLAETLIYNIYGKALPRCSLYVEIPDPVPACVTMLFPTTKAHQVFRVFIDDYKPFHVMPMNSLTLKPKGWRWTGSLPPNNQPERSSAPLYWWHYQRGVTELTRNTIFRVRMNGHVEAVWNATDDDPEFAAYLKHALDERRRRREFLAARRRIERTFGPMD